MGETDQIERFSRPAQADRWRRFLWGLTLPLAIYRTTRVSPEDWAAWKRVAIRQGILTLVTGCLVIGAFTAAILAVVAWARAQPDANVEVSQGARFYVEILTGVVAIFGVCEWIVIALSREHHEQLTRRMSIRCGVPPEDAERAPRVRVDLRWIGRRIRRWARGVRAFIAVFPLVVLVGIPLQPVLGKHAYTVIAFAWTAYWAMVLAAAKSAVAWRTEDDPAAPPPWFVRVLTRVPIVRVYGRFVGWMSRTSFPPAREIEPHAWEFLGLAVARAIAGLPGLYAFARPTLPLASAIVLGGPIAKVGQDEGPLL